MVGTGVDGGIRDIPNALVARAGNENLRAALRLLLDVVTMEHNSSYLLPDNYHPSRIIQYRHAPRSIRSRRRRCGSMPMSVFRRSSMTWADSAKLECPPGS
jgi:hypothetical protein